MSEKKFNAVCPDCGTVYRPDEWTAFETGACDRDHCDHCHAEKKGCNSMTTQQQLATVPPEALAELERLAQHRQVVGATFYAEADEAETVWKVVYGSNRTLCLFCTESEARFIAAACNAALPLVALVRELQGQVESAQLERVEAENYHQSWLDDTREQTVSTIKRADRAEAERDEWSEWARVLSGLDVGAEDSQVQWVVSATVRETVPQLCDMRDKSERERDELRAMLERSLLLVRLNSSYHGLLRCSFCGVTVATSDMFDDPSCHENDCLRFAARALLARTGAQPEPQTNE